MGVKGITMPGGAEGISKLFIPDFKTVIDNGELSSLVIDAIGQVFFSLSIMISIMVAYGSYLPEGTNIAKDASIIALADLGVSVLSGIVMFTTMYGVGMTTNDMSASGIKTAFIIYPQAIANLTDNGWVNAAFGMIFYLCLSSLAIDSAFSIIEGVATAVASRFKLNVRKVNRAICCVAAVLSIAFITESGLAWLDIVDNWTNQYNMILVGVMECIVVGWVFKPQKVLDEINRNSEGYKLSPVWFISSIKVIAPVLLTVFFVLNIKNLIDGGGVYGSDSGYPLWSNIVGGWAVTFLVFTSGFIAKIFAKKVDLDYQKKDVWK